MVRRMGDPKAEHALEQCVAKQRFRQFCAKGTLVGKGKTSHVRYAFVDDGTQRNSAGRTLESNPEFFLILHLDTRWGYEVHGATGIGSPYRKATDPDKATVLGTAMRCSDLVPVDYKGEKGLDVSYALTQPTAGSRLELKWTQTTPRLLDSATMDIGADGLPSRAEQAIQGGRRVIRFDDWYSPDGAGFVACRARYWEGTDTGPPSAEFTTERSSINLSVAKRIFDATQPTSDWDCG
jgi:hypothetical protein